MYQKVRRPSPPLIKVTITVAYYNRSELFGIVAFEPFDSFYSTIRGIIKDTPAERFGFKDGDRIPRNDEKRISRREYGFRMEVVRVRPLPDRGAPQQLNVDSVENPSHKRICQRESNVLRPLIDQREMPNWPPMLQTAPYRLPQLDADSITDDEKVLLDFMKGIFGEAERRSHRMFRWERSCFVHDVAYYPDDIKRILHSP